MRNKTFALLHLIFSICLLPALVQAGGIILYEISSADTRLASAGWSSRAEDPSTLFTNPAGMTRIQSPKLQMGLQAINAHVDFYPNAKTNVPGTKGNANIWLPSGSFFYVHPINESLSVGFGSIGYFGADLKYNNSWVGRYYVDHTFLEGFSAVPAAAYKINDCISIGIGANVMYGIFRQKSAIRNVLDGLPDGRLKLHDEDLACGAVAGILFELSPCTRIGVQYLSPVKLRFHDTPHFQGVGPVLERILRVTGLLHSTVKVIARVPQNVILSAYHALNVSWSLMADVGWQQWSRFEKVSVFLPFPDVPSLTSKIKYKDTWHTAVGAEYHLNPCWTLSGGIAYDSSAISNKERPLDFPIGKQWRFGTGVRWFYSENLIFDLCYEFQWSGSLFVDVNKGPLVGHVAGKFRDTYVQFINANVTWAF